MNKQILVLLFCLGLSACGWHLRGLEALPEGLQQLHLDVSGLSPDLSRSLQSSLRNMGVELVDKQTAQYSLSISDIQSQRRTVSTGGNARAAEYELTSRMSYRIADSEGTVLDGPAQLSAERAFVFDSNNVNSAQQEENLIREELQRDLLQQIIRRLQRVGPAQGDS